MFNMEAEANACSRSPSVIGSFSGKPSCRAASFASCNTSLIASWLYFLVVKRASSAVMVPCGVSQSGVVETTSRGLGCPVSGACCAQAAKIAQRSVRLRGVITTVGRNCIPV